MKEVGPENDRTKHDDVRQCIALTTQHVERLLIAEDKHDVGMTNLHLPVNVKRAASGGGGKAVFRRALVGFARTENR